MAILHLLSGSPYPSAGLSLVVNRAQPGDALVLLRDAAYAVIGESLAWVQVFDALGRDLSIYCLAPDLEARGIGLPQVGAGVEVIDYAAFVVLSVRFPRACSW